MTPFTEKREGYKKTELGWIPEDWELRPLLESCLKITDGSHFSPIPQKEGYLIATVKDMANHDFNYERCTRITEKDYNDLKRNGCAPEIDDVLFSKDGTIGKSFVYNNFQKIVVLSSIAIIKTRKKDLSPYYLIQVLKSNFFNTQLEGLKSGSALKRLILKSINKIKIPLPPLFEQQKIAAILSTVDEKIDAIDTEINAIEKLKKALMRQLLTRGIGHTEFKETELGCIPKNWSCVKAKQIFINFSSKNHVDEELLSATQDKGVLPRSMLETRVMMPEGTVSGYKLVEKGDFVISLRTFQGGIEFSEYRGIVSPAYTVLRSTVDIYKPFFKFVFKTGDFINRLGVAVIGIRDGKQICYKDFAELYLPLPPISEQQKIANILSTVDEKLDILREKKETYQTLKKGLMQQLLTGALRVTHVHLNPEIRD